MVGRDQAAGDGHGTAADPELTAEERWLRLWAFGTSRHGLGIPESRLWQLSHREYHALTVIYNRSMERWALERAMFANAHFDTEGTPFVPDDFLGRVSREARKLAASHAALEVMQANRALAMMKPGDTTGVPDWAIVPEEGK